MCPRSLPPVAPACSCRFEPCVYGKRVGATRTEGCLSHSFLSFHNCPPQPQGAAGECVCHYVRISSASVSWIAVSASVSAVCSHVAWFKDAAHFLSPAPKVLFPPGAVPRKIPESSEADSAGKGLGQEGLILADLITWYPWELFCIPNCGMPGSAHMVSVGSRLQNRETDHTVSEALIASTTLRQV